MTPIVEYLSHGTLLENRAEAVKVKAIATRYSLIDRMLYRRLFFGPYLRCLPCEEIEKVIVQFHQGVCGTHIKGTDAVPPNYNSGLLLANDEARGSGVYEQV